VPDRTVADENHGRSRGRHIDAHLGRGRSVNLVRILCKQVIGPYGPVVLGPKVLDQGYCFDG
jgi:hypothetical protein